MRKITRRSFLAAAAVCGAAAALTACGGSSASSTAASSVASSAAAGSAAASGDTYTIGQSSTRAAISEGLATVSGTITVLFKDMELVNAALSLSEAPMNWGLCYYYYFRGRSGVEACV